MIPKSICSVIEFQCLIAFLSFHESFFPTTLRQWSRNSGGVFPLEFCLGGLRCLNIEYIPLQHRQAHDLDVNFFKLRKGFQTQTWDPGVPLCRFANGGIRLLIDHISGRRFMFVLAIETMSSSIAFSYWRLFFRRNQTVLLRITILLVFNPMVIRETFCGRIHQQGVSSTFRSQIGTVTLAVVVRCCFVYINYRSVISDVVVMTTINGHSYWMLKVLRAFIPKCERRPRTRTSIFLLLMEDNPSEKLQEAITRSTFHLWSLKNANKRIRDEEQLWALPITKKDVISSRFLLGSDVTDGSLPLIVLKLNGVSSKER
ncbi:unnamed protein product [Arabidopsis halleri]